MARVTQHDLIVANLKAKGYVEVPDASSRYTVLHKEGSSAAWFWVGRGGAARFNGVKRIDGSRPVSRKTKAVLIQPLGA